MPDNVSDDMIVQLIKYVDDELALTDKAGMEKLLQNNIALKERYEKLLAAKEAIRSRGLAKRVQKIQEEYTHRANPAKESAKIIKPGFFKIFMRAAAVLFIGVAGFLVFEYTSTTTQSEYNNNFVIYHEIVNRGDSSFNSLAAAYNGGNYDNAITIFNSIKNKNQHDYFIAAQCYLIVNNVSGAINAFKAVENLNSKSLEKNFEQETDYYLMLAYIKNGDIELAEQKLHKINANKQHLFYNKARNISQLKLDLLKWKT